MAGISNNALKGVNYPQNRKKYNGIEFTEDLDLDIYDAQLRNLDPQIGRWNQIDPKTEDMEMWSPYASNYDNPIRFNDFLGDEPGDGEPGVLPAVGIAFLQKMDENLNAGIDAVMGALGDVGVSLGGILNGMNQNATAGAYPSVSASQFGLNERQTSLYNSSTTVGALAPGVLPGGKPGASPELAPVNGKPFEVLPYKVEPVAPQSQVNAGEGQQSSNPGRSGKQERLRELANDTKQSSANRGWIKNEIRHIDNGNRKTIRLPGNSRNSKTRGWELAHPHGKRAKDGHSYKDAKLQTAELHKLEHKVHGY